MVVKVSVKQNIDQITKRYKERGQRLAKVTPAHKQVAVFLDTWVQRNIKTDGGNLSDGAWPDFKFGGRAVLDQYYDEDNPPPGNYVFEQHLSAGGVVDVWVDHSAKLLRDTGALRLSFLPFATQRNAGIGSNLKYSKSHNDRTDKWQRRLLPHAKEVHDRIREILDAFGKKSLGIKKK